MIINNINYYLKNDFQIIWQSGKKNYRDIPENIKAATEPTQMFDIYGPMENNTSNIELESAENITLRQYIANEPSNQEILNKQYNKYYWAN